MPKIVMAKLSGLKPSGYNPRDATEQERTEVRKSLSKFGMVEPLVVNRQPKRNGILVGGHLRSEMAAELGIKEVTTVEVNLTERREKELSLRLNRTGEWDWDKLATEFSRAELEAVGFDESDMETLEDETVPKESIGVAGEFSEAGFRLEMTFTSDKQYREAKESFIGSDIFERTENLLKHYRK